ncbi:hypothetical protein GCM10010195_46410 [Kitasatospora griseola]|nr:hypothetical protein GCM10010195_46410 [Kitasatospora griseola]
MERISDSGVTGPAFLDHVCPPGCPVLNSPRGQTVPLPADLTRRPVVPPEMHRPWLLVRRADEARGAVPAMVPVPSVTPPKGSGCPEIAARARRQLSEAAHSP